METVEIGSIVKCLCAYPTFTKNRTFEIVGHGETDLSNGKLGYESPVAKNIIGLHKGDIVSFDTPGGQATYTILQFYPDWDCTEGEYK